MNLFVSICVTRVGRIHGAVVVIGMILGLVWYELRSVPHISKEFS